MGRFINAINIQMTSNYFDNTLPFVALALLLLAAIAAIAYLVLLRWETALPNEWLLLIQDGRLVRAGVGLTVFRSLNAQVVRFSSNMHKVTWKAQEMTNQRAGVEVKGFAIWGIYRPDAEDPDGPFRAYKSIPGLADGDVTAGSQFVQQLVESIIRSSVANMSIMDVMQKRDAMRDKVKKEITSQLKGWGIWLETVEIIDCRISSQSLFEDMQCLSDDQLTFANRSEAKLSAETVRMATQSKIDESTIETRRFLDEKRLVEQQVMDQKRIDSELATALRKADTQAQRQIEELAHKLKVEKENNAIQVERDAMRMQRVEQEKAIQLASAAQEAAVADFKEMQRMALAAKVAEQEMTLLRAKLEIEQGLTPVNLQKMQLDAVQSIYAKLPLREVKLVNMAGGQQGGLDSLLPGLMEVGKQVSGKVGEVFSDSDGLQ